ncbi:unnamed protein product [Thlaspi arvense]|uniref:DC-UbP/UBTD2 N-terminal domain-containing protein n=1 Tax=Thlaspi arvense TaxID=13288 RepID=A0AAU9RLB7_THLAR|nr:unnamed protein product [Thlaspi arvense]
MLDQYLQLVAYSMGCHSLETRSIKKIRKPKPWKHTESITRAQLVQMREEFWDTAPHYGGRREMVSVTASYHPVLFHMC